MTDYKPFEKSYCAICVLPFPQRYTKVDQYYDTEPKLFICQLCYIKELEKEVKNKSVQDKVDGCNCCKSRLTVLLSDIDNYLNN